MKNNVKMGRLNHYDKHVYRGGNHQMWRNIPYVSFRRRVNAVLFFFVYLFAPCNVRCRSRGPNIKCTYFHILDSGLFYNKHECHGHNDQVTGDINTVHQWIQTSLNLFESVKVRKGVSLVEISSDHSVAPSRRQVIIYLKMALFLYPSLGLHDLMALLWISSLPIIANLHQYFYSQCDLYHFFQKSCCNYVQINGIIATLARLMPSGFFVWFKEHYSSNITRSHYHIIYRIVVVSSRPNSTRIWVSVDWAV